MRYGRIDILSIYFYFHAIEKIEKIETELLFKYDNIYY